MSLTQKELDFLRLDIGANPKYRTYEKYNMSESEYARERKWWEEEGSDGGEWSDYGPYGPQRTSTTELNFDYYKGNPTWKKVQGLEGITRINSENDLRRMYAYVNGAKVTPPAPPPKPKVDTIQQTYQKQIADLTKRVETIQAAPPKANVPPPKPPTTPYSVRTAPISLSNPYKSKSIGGIGQFKQNASSGLATIKSKLINI